jgi:hypothetical protein
MAEPAKAVRLEVTAQDRAEVAAIASVQPSERDVSSMPGAVKREWLDERGVRQWEVTVPLHDNDGAPTRAFGDVMDAQNPVVRKQTERVSARDARSPKLEIVNRYGERVRVDERFESQLVDRTTDHYVARVGGRRLRQARDGHLWAVGTDGYWEPTGKFTVTGEPTWRGTPGRVTEVGVYHDPDENPWMFDGKDWECLNAAEAEG